MTNRTNQQPDQPSGTTARPEISQVWRTHRKRLVDIGYRMLGSVAEAEDVADEAYARLLVADADSIESMAGWLTTVTGRLCIDRLRSADLRRREYVRPWLPEPIVSTDAGVGADPADRVTLDESVRLALLVVLDKLSPAERTSFVLHDLFAVSFEEVGAIVGRSPAACRQLASRARRRIQTDPEKPRADVDRDELAAVARRFALACSGGAIEPLLELLDPDVVGDFDSGGMVPGAPLRAIDDPDRIARLLTNVFTSAPFEFSVQDVNGEPGVVGRIGTEIRVVIALGVHEGKVDFIHGIGNPEKLPRG